MSAVQDNDPSPDNTEHSQAHLADQDSTHTPKIKKSGPRRKPPRPGTSIHWPLYVRTPSLAILGVWAVGLTLLLYFWNTITLILLVLLAAAAVASTLKPIAKLIPGKRWLVGAGVGILFVIVLFTVPALIGWLLSEPIAHIIHQLPEIQQAMNHTLLSISQKLHLAEPITVNSLFDYATAWIKSGHGNGVLAQAAGAIFSGTIAVMLMCFGTIYLLAQQPRRLTNPLERLLPEHRQGALHQSVAKIEVMLRWWLMGTICAMVIICLLCWAGFAFMGLQYALPLAILAGLCEIIPIVGPTLAFFVALLVAAGQGWTVFVGVAIIYLIIQSFESHVLQPLVMNKAVSIPPVVVLFTLVLWAEVIGPIGLLLAVPLDLTIWIFIENFIINEGLIDYDYPSVHRRHKNQ